MHFSSLHSALIYLSVECSQWLSINMKIWKKVKFFLIEFPMRVLNFRLTFTVISMFMLYFVNLIENMLLNANNLSIAGNCSPDAWVSIICYSIFLWIHDFKNGCGITSRLCYSLGFIHFSFSLLSSINVIFIVVYDLIKLQCVLFVLHAFCRVFSRLFSFILQTDNKYLEICTNNTLNLVYLLYC